MNALQTSIDQILTNACDALTCADTLMAGVLDYRAVLTRVQADPAFAGLDADVQQAVSFRANDDLAIWDTAGQSLRESRSVLDARAAQIRAALRMGRLRRG
jgi:hypothetical protein